MSSLSKNRVSRYRYLYITLGFLSAFGPFVTDMYLPALPMLAKQFDCSPSSSQMSLTMSMFGLALGQILIGPVSDKYGRRHLLLGSLILFTLSTILCIFSPNIMVFNILRLFQGIAGAGGIVLSRSVATDLCSGERLTQMIAMMSAVNGIAPVVAPIVGGLLMSFTSWRGIFVCLLIVGIILLLLSLNLRESLAKRNRLQSSVLSTFTKYKSLTTNKTYLIHFSIYMFSMVMLFAYVSSSTFILQDVYNLNSLVFSLFFALNALSIGAGCAIAGHLHGKSSLKYGALTLIVGTVFSIFALCVFHSVVLVEISFFVIMLGFGLLQPISTAIALDSGRDNAGVASAALGASGFFMGGLVAPLVSMGNILISTALIFIVGCLLTCLFVLISLKQKKPLPIS